MSDQRICANTQCEHLHEDHDDHLGLCLVPRCSCLRFVDEDDEADEVEPLDFETDR